MKRLYNLLVTLILLCVTSTTLNAQSIGIGTDFPIASLDIRTNNIISSIFIDRIASASTSVGAVKIEDESDWVGLEVYEFNDAALVASYVENQGLGNAFWATNVDPANTQPAGFFTNAGNGSAIMSSITVGTGTAQSLDVYQGGMGDGVQIFMDNSLNGNTNTEDGLEIRHLGTAGFGIFTDMYNASQTMLNYIGIGNGIENVHYGDGGTSFISNMVSLDGSNNLVSRDGNGYMYANIDDILSPTLSSDGIGYSALINSETPVVVGGTVTGAILVGTQYGPGWGTLINHEGVSGRNAEFNVINDSNADAAIFSVHNGGGNSLVAQNQSTGLISGIVEVLDASYLGDDIDDHKGVAAYSYPADGFGIGVEGIGGFYGVVGIFNGTGLGGAAVHAVGDITASGVKPFMIDHPLDPANKILKHFALESNEVLNVYQGTARLTREGRAIVSLPDYFHAININYNYQLTSIGTSEQAWIYKEIQNGKFIIAGKPGSKVSWMVVANRNDAYVRKNPDRLKNTIAKRGQDEGKYLDPISHGMPISARISYSEVKKQQPSKVPENMANIDKESLHRPSKERKTVFSTATTNPATQSKLPERIQPTREAIEKTNLKMKIKTWDELGIE